MYPSDQVADLRAEVTHWYENLQKEQMNQQAQLQEFGQSGRQPGDFPGRGPAASTPFFHFSFTIDSGVVNAALKKASPMSSYFDARPHFPQGV